MNVRSRYYTLLNGMLLKQYIALVLSLSSLVEGETGSAVVLNQPHPYMYLKKHYCTS